MTHGSIRVQAAGMRGRLIATLLIAVAMAIVAAFALAAPTRADPPASLPDAPLHRHFVRAADGTLVPVGPQICDNPELQQAFNEFHYNIHHSVLPGSGPVVTLGPQDGAPGLHNQRGADLVAMPGCG
jgi:hypothetical protein